MVLWCTIIDINQNIQEKEIMIFITDQFRWIYDIHHLDWAPLTSLNKDRKMKYHSYRTKWYQPKSQNKHCWPNGDTVIQLSAGYKHSHFVEIEIYQFINVSIQNWSKGVIIICFFSDINYGHLKSLNPSPTLSSWTRSVQSDRMKRGNERKERVKCTIPDAAVLLDTRNLYLYGPPRHWGKRRKIYLTVEKGSLVDREKSTTIRQIG